MKFLLPSKGGKKLAGEELIDDLIANWYIKHSEKLFFIAYGKLFDFDASKDAVHTIFARLCENLKIKKSKTPDDIERYLAVAVKNYALNLAKYGSNKVDISEVDVRRIEESDLSQEAFFDRKDIKKLLSFIEYKVFVLMLNGLGRRDIAQQLNLKINNLYQIEFRIKRKLIARYKK